jgi:4-hydroxyphenylpyruvate dioxygenase-like putative hemolysin
MILKNYPIKMNNTVIPFPNSYSEKNSVSESVNQTEAGTDVCQVERIKKLTLSLSFRLMGSWASFFESIAYSTSTVSVDIFDNQTQAYASKTMRMRNYSKSLVPLSENLDIAGMYDMSFELIEM